MLLFFSCFTLAAVVALYIVRTARVRGGRWLHDRYSGPHKFHGEPVPRVGGVAVAMAALLGAGLLYLQDQTAGTVALTLLLCAMPAFSAGMAEDVTKAIPPAPRLLLTACSAVLGIWLLGAVIDRTTLPAIDWVLSLPAVAVLFTVFAVTGMANAVNIVDGFNGLSSMCVAIILACFGYVGFVAGDSLIVSLSVIGLGAVLGFFVWNFPLGLIFLGDGGAYFLGFYVAEVGILLIDRNPQVSPLFPMLVCIYPVFETLFSMYRKRLLRGMSPGYPDGVHLHMLVYRRIIRWAMGRKPGRHAARLRNSMTSPYLWLMCMLAAAPAVLLWNDTFWLAVFLCVFGVTYVTLYWRIVRFRTPRLLVLHRPPRKSGAQ